MLITLLTLICVNCGECVDTEDACGWCLYGGFCSANSDPCPEPAGVNDTYLKVHFATIVSVRS